MEKRHKTASLIWAVRGLIVVGKTSSYRSTPKVGLRQKPDPTVQRWVEACRLPTVRKHHVMCPFNRKGALTPIRRENIVRRVHRYERAEPAQKSGGTPRGGLTELDGGRQRPFRPSLLHACFGWISFFFRISLFDILASTRPQFSSPLARTQKTGGRGVGAWEESGFSADLWIWTAEILKLCEASINEKSKAWRPN